MGNCCIGRDDDDDSKSAPECTTTRVDCWTGRPAAKIPHPKSAFRWYVNPFKPPEDYPPPFRSGV